MVRSLVTPAQFLEQAVPELQRRWASHCFCRNENFLKLISFDFRDYEIAPVALADSEIVIANIVLKLFTPMDEWSETGRTHRCPQCGEMFRSQSEQFSINMDCITTRACGALAAAAMGHYVIGFQFFAGEEASIARIKDFQLAASVEQFIDDISRADQPASLATSASDNS